MASWLVYLTLDLVVWIQATPEGHNVCCVLVQEQWTSIPSRVEGKIILVASCNGNWDKLGKSLPYETCFLQWVSPLHSILHYRVLSGNVYLQVHLRGYVNRLFAAITCSAMACPTVMCQVFHNIREAAAWKFPSKMLHNF